ncbi:hypothetical protein ACOXH8_29010 [Nannocystis pusilla]
MALLLLDEPTSGLGDRLDRLDGDPVPEELCRRIGADMVMGRERVCGGGSISIVVHSGQAVFPGATSGPRSAVPPSRCDHRRR